MNNFMSINVITQMQWRNSLKDTSDQKKTNKILNSTILNNLNSKFKTFPQIKH